jgi:hypothetical protein
MNWEDRRIAGIGDLHPHVVAAFAKAGLSTAGTVVDEYMVHAVDAERITELARKVGLDQSETARVVAAVLPDASDQITSTWWSRHWADAVVGLAALALFSLGVRSVVAPPKPLASATVASGPAEPLAGPILLPVQHMIPVDTSKLPLDVDLLFSSRGDSPAGAVFQARLADLATVNSPPTATLRVSRMDLPEIAKWIGSSDVTILLKLR